MDDPPVHTKQNHHPTKMNVLPKAFLQIILAGLCGIQVRSPNQQRRPLPSLLSLSFFLWGKGAIFRVAESFWCRRSESWRLSGGGCRPFSRIPFSKVPSSRIPSSWIPSSRRPSPASDILPCSLIIK